jgi:X-Pro dipeptidyl-peptidase (S15 family)
MRYLDADEAVQVRSLLLRSVDEFVLIGGASGFVEAALGRPMTAARAEFRAYATATENASRQQPPGLKAIFPTVPAADPYRDVTAAGGELDAGFLPQWFMLVSSAGAIPPARSPSRTRGRP